MKEIKEIDSIIKKKRLLLPILEALQNKYGSLTPNALKYLSRKLKKPYSEIYSTATFYLMFSTKKQGKNVILLCNSPSCHVNGSLNLLNFLKKELKISPGETTKDKRFTLGFTPCLGCCDKAPAILFNGKVYGSLTETKLKNILKKAKK